MKIDWAFFAEHQKVTSHEFQEDMLEAAALIGYHHLDSGESLEFEHQHEGSTLVVTVERKN